MKYISVRDSRESVSDENLMKILQAAIRMAVESYDAPKKAPWNVILPSAIANRQSGRVDIQEDIPWRAPLHVSTLGLSLGDEKKSTMSYTVFRSKPEQFATMRRLCGYDSQQFVSSLCDVPMRFGATQRKAGKSGSIFWESRDGRFIIKSITPVEYYLLSSLMPSYTRHVRRFPDSLLCRFLGMYKISSSKPHFSLRVVVMLNVFNSSITRRLSTQQKGHMKQSLLKEKVFQKFDLKGSTEDRFVKVQSGTEVLKDLNFGNNKLVIAPVFAAKLCHVLRQDSQFLMKQGIMDYSLILGVVNMEAFSKLGHGSSYELGNTLSAFGAARRMAFYCSSTCDIVPYAVTERSMSTLETAPMPPRSAFKSQDSEHSDHDRDAANYGVPGRLAAIPELAVDGPQESPNGHIAPLPSAQASFIDTPKTPQTASAVAMQTSGVQASKLIPQMVNYLAPKNSFVDFAGCIPAFVQRHDSHVIGESPGSSYIDGRRSSSRSNSSDLSLSVIHLGIVDVLQQFTLKKKIAYMFKKTTIGCCHEIDTEPPKYYQERFQRYLDSKIDAADSSDVQRTLQEFAARVIQVAYRRVKAGKSLRVPG